MWLGGDRACRRESRGDLNLVGKLVIYSVYLDFYCSLEYQLEYCSPFDYLHSSDSTSMYRNHAWQ